MKTRKRILAGILTAILTISMLPSVAFATETTGSEPEPETAVVSSEEQEKESVTEELFPAAASN